MYCMRGRPVLFIVECAGVLAVQRGTLRSLRHGHNRNRNVQRSVSCGLVCVGRRRYHCFVHCLCGWLAHEHGDRHWCQQLPRMRGGTGMHAAPSWGTGPGVVLPVFEAFQARRLYGQPECAERLRTMLAAARSLRSDTRLPSTRPRPVPDAS